MLKYILEECRMDIKVGDKVEMKKQLGKTVKVLVENVSRDNQTEMLGRTSRDERVVFKADNSLIGNFVDVKLETLSGNTFKGIMV